MMGLALREQLESHILHWNSAILGTMICFPGPVVCCAYVLQPSLEVAVAAIELKILSIAEL